jgi:hypothetical protein
MNPEQFIERIFQRIYGLTGVEIFARHFNAAGFEIRRDDGLFVRPRADEIRGQAKAETFCVAV